MVRVCKRLIDSSFGSVINMKETSDLEPGVTEDNLHAPGVGHIIDNDTKLVSYGYLKSISFEKAEP